MNATQIINRTITAVFLWKKMEPGGLDQAQVYIELDHEITIGIPADFESVNIEMVPPEGAENLFADLSDISHYPLNSDITSIREGWREKRKQNTVFGRIRRFFKREEQSPKPSLSYKIEYSVNKPKFIKDQKIVDLLIPDNPFDGGFIVLENGCILFETPIAPHGIGAAGLSMYKNLEEFEKRYGSNYQSLIGHAT
ncbi:MAG: hypothetical protein MUC87_19520 [Bacteroidia bacterium]|jgi:hypothetical protein|nr:hypothetical protein [Bacteroidia bacterium]